MITNKYYICAGETGAVTKENLCNESAVHALSNITGQQINKQTQNEQSTTEQKIGTGNGIHHPQWKEQGVPA